MQHKLVSIPAKYTNAYLASYMLLVLLAGKIGMDRLIGKKIPSL